MAPLSGYVVAMLLWHGHPSQALAQTDEIQVYDAAIAPTGAFNLTLHNNFTASGNTARAFPEGSSRTARLTALPSGPMASHRGSREDSIFPCIRSRATAAFYITL